MPTGLFFRFLALLCSLAMAGTAHAEDGTPSVRIHGFGTIGLSHADTNFGGSFARDASQIPGGTGLQFKNDSRLGIQANAQLTNQIELVTQLVARSRFATGKDTDAIEWAFASFRPSDDVNLRIGRVGADLYMLSDYRNVGIGYTTVRPPVDFYGVMSLGSLDGLDVTKTWVTDRAQWKLKAFAGNSNFQAADMRGPFKGIGGLVLARESDGFTIRGTYANGNIHLRAPDFELLRTGLGQLISLTRYTLPNVAAQAQTLMDGSEHENVRVRYLTMGASYDKHDWVAQAEIMRIQSNSGIAAGKGAYALVGKRLGDWTPYLGISQLRSVTPPYIAPNWGKDLAPFAPIIGASAVAQAQYVGQEATARLNAWRVDQRTISLGARWDVTPTAALKFQLDRVIVKPQGTLLWQGQPGGGRAWVGSMALDFMF